MGGEFRNGQEFGSMTRKGLVAADAILVSMQNRQLQSLTWKLDEVQNQREQNAQE